MSRHVVQRFVIKNSNFVKNVKRSSSRFFATTQHVASSSNDVSQSFMDAAIRSLNESDDVNSPTTTVQSKVRLILLILLPIIIHNYTYICTTQHTHTHRFQM